MIVSLTLKAMPGYDRNRFRELSPEQVYDFLCGICQDIVRQPVVAPCCRHLYCEDCIKLWFNTSKTCPNDRRHLSSHSLTLPSIALTNQLAKLKIECDFASNGCDRVCDLDQLAHHLAQECHYNPDRKCRKCGAIKDNEEHHSCTQYLCSIIGGMRTQLQSLIEQTQQTYATEVQNYFEETMKLRSEVDMLKKEIERSNNESLLSVQLVSFSEQFLNQIECLKREIQVLKNKTATVIEID